MELDYPPEFSDWNLQDLPKLLDTAPLKRVTESGIVNALQGIVRQFDRVIIATDFDREGELIGLECLELLQQVHPTIEVRRARYSALTREAIEDSFSNLQELDHALAAAASARQEIDLVWGALLTRFLSLTAEQRGRSFLSAGRVQTPTLALLVERDQEIKEFVPTPFWEVLADGEKDGTSFRLSHAHGTFTHHAEAEAIFRKVETATDATVKNFGEEELRKRPPVPFSTTLFVAEANRSGWGRRSRCGSPRTCTRRASSATPGRTTPSTPAAQGSSRSSSDSARASFARRRSTSWLSPRSVRPAAAAKPRTTLPFTLRVSPIPGS